MPYPENLDHHFVVDPTKFDFFAMDCYRMLEGDRMAETLADEVIRASTDSGGIERAPMRLAEARITLGVIAARLSGLASGLALAVRPAGLAEVSRVKGLRLRSKRRAEGAPLRLEGPARTMRGVPGPALSHFRW